MQPERTSGPRLTDGRAVPEPDYFAVRAFRKEVPEKFLGYPLVTDRDGWICRKLLPACERILEIGAGDRPFESELRARGFTGVFKTMDVDHSRRFDYYSLDEVDGPFDGVLMREVIEHLPRPVFYAYLARIAALLRKGGVLIVTTPNPWAVTWLFADYTHVSPWPPADLYGVLRWYGFSAIEIRRIVWPSRFLWIKRAYWAVHSRFYDLDFAGSYLVAAIKTG